MSIMVKGALRSKTGAPVQRIVLDVSQELTFRPGQYVEVVHPDGTIPLSVASGPRRLPELHLHYRSTPGIREAEWMDQLLAGNEPLVLRGPHGDVCLPEDDQLRLLLVAGGTGITQVCAILDELVHVRERAAVSVLWCADKADDLYCRREFDRMQAPWLTVEYVVDDRRGSENAGLTRLRELADGSAAAADWILLAGSPGFVYAAADVLTEKGIDQSLLHADAFAYAPRAIAAR